MNRRLSGVIAATCFLLMVALAGAANASAKADLANGCW